MLDTNKRIIKKCVLVILQADGTEKGYETDEAVLDNVSVSFTNRMGNTLTFPINRLVKIRQRAGGEHYD